MHHDVRHSRVTGRRVPPMPHTVPGAAFDLFKRALDVTGALTGIFLAAPLLMVCAAWIKCVDGGPMFYWQWRVGRQGWLFRLYKLRTMHRKAETPGGARLAQRRDPRILPCCTWMRKTHVDELPQLWNILVGQMSLVGPRPERPEILEELRTDLPGIDARLQARPGLTGLAQICNGYTNDLAGARRKLAYDLRYLRRRSIRGDVQLLLRTVPKLWDHAAL